MNELQIFNNPEFGDVRTLEINDETWFIAKDVANALGFANPRSAVSNHVYDDDKGVETIDTPGGKQSLTIINESGVYALVFSSRLENAKKFKKWVTSEILPSIRKTGLYAADELLNNPDLMIEAMQKLKAERLKSEQLTAKNEALELENKAQEQIINELKPKVNYLDIILGSKNLLNITQIAKDYGMSGVALNRILEGLHIQYKQRDQWLLYSKYQDQGYTSSETATYKDSQGNLQTRLSTKWTQKGRLFLYEILKKNGTVPTIEKDNI